MITTKPAETRWIGRPPVFLYPNGETVRLPVHEAFLASRAKRQILVVHRRGRKTSMTLEKMFQYLATRPKTVGKTLAPIRKQAKEIIWDDPDMLFHPNILHPSLIAKVNKTDLSVRLKNGSIWSLDGMDDPKTKRGSNVKVLHLTEAGDHQEETWTQIYEPILLANGGVAIFEGNPRGRNWYYRLFENAPERSNPVWDRFLVSAEDTPIYTKEQLEDLRQHTPDAVFRAEYLCEWVDSVGTVFRDFERLMVLDPSRPEKGRSYRAGLDLAKHQDYTVNTIVDRHTWDEVDLDRFNNMDWPSIKRRLKQKFAAFSKKANGNSLEVQIESNGVGDPIFDDLFMWAGSTTEDPDLNDGDTKIVPGRDLNIIIVPFLTNVTNKQMLVSDISLKMETSMCRLIKNEVVKKEMEEFTYKKTPQHFIYGHPVGGHDDTVMSKMLAYWNIGYKLDLPKEEQPERHQWGMTEAQRQRLIQSQNDPFGLA